MDEFWGDLLLFVILVLGVFCVAGLVAGLIFSPAARVALGIWAVIIGASACGVWVMRWLR